MDPAQKREKLTAESANGRLVTIAIIGVFGQGCPTGSAWGDGALYPSPPLRASRTSGGVRGTVGFWDPAGLTADGNEENFVHHRQADLKHGRIAQLALLGYIRRRSTPTPAPEVIKWRRAPCGGRRAAGGGRRYTVIGGKLRDRNHNMPVQ